MPTPAEQLPINASKQQRQEAISSCISQLSAERPGDSSDQIQAI